VARIIVGIVIVLHGLVHLLYVGQSSRLFELQPGMVWPDGSWAFSRFLGAGATRLLASLSFVLAAIALVAGGAGLLLRQTWWRPTVVVAAAFSSAVVVLFWDGTFQQLDNQGLIAVLINIAILAAVLIVRWPRI
jgi:hypothetical protein